MRTFRRWDERASTEGSNELLRELALEILGCAKSQGAVLAIRDMLIRRDYAGIVNYELAYGSFDSDSDLLDVITIRQVLAFFQKRADLDIGIDKKEAAAAKFLEADKLCAESNHIFNLWSQGKFVFHPDVEAVLHGATRKIARCLGEVPKLSDLVVRFGPGATTKVKKENSSWRNKLSAGLQCSEEFLPLLSEALAELPAWVELESVSVPNTVGSIFDTDTHIAWESDPKGNDYLVETEVAELSVDVVTGKLSFVPKNAKTLRVVKPEPVLNGMFQLGIGEYMARRLSALGIDITDQTRNQRLAKVGSLTGALATLDLSSASDTISIGAVSHLLPLEWFCFLSNLRSGRIEHPTDQDRVWETSMFSQMGNGFTFPLETLIFWALTSASADLMKSSSEISVYGDDIIVGTEVVPLLIRVLHAVGFVVNEKKSYWTGNFRESCGKDYLSGFDIRPVYVKDCLSCDTAFVLRNFFWREGGRDIARYIENNWLDESVRLYGPDGYGDGCLVQDDPPLTPHKRAEGWAGWTFEAWTWRSRKSFAKRLGDQVLPGYSIYANPSSPYSALKGVFEYGLDLPRKSQKGYLGQWMEERRMFSVLAHTACDETGEWCLYEPYSSPNLLQRRKKGNRVEYITGSTLPGTDGFKKISIYTLRPA